MESTAKRDSPPIPAGRSGFIAAPLQRAVLVICLCTLLLPRSLSGQESPGRDRPGNPTTADADPAATARRLLSGPAAAPDDAHHGHTLIETARAVGRQGDLETALQLLSMALEHYQSGPLAGEYRSILTARLGISSAAWQLGEHDLVIEHASELLRLPGDGSTAAQRAAAQQLLAKSLLQRGDVERALQITLELAEAAVGSSTAAAVKAFTQEHALAIGGAALRAQQHVIAGRAYRFYLSNAPQGPRAADALLGVAWTAAMGGEPPQQAVQRLSEFVAAYPEHHDVPHALRAQAGLLLQLGRAAEAEQLGLQLLSDYPASDAAAEVLQEVLLELPVPWAAPIRTAWIQRLDERVTAAGEAGGADELANGALAQLLTGALGSSDDALWQAAVAVLLHSDPDGSRSRSVFELLAPAETLYVAEHLAVDLLGRLIDARAAATPAAALNDAVPPACETACRWAGMSGRWSMLALVAEQLEPPHGPRRDPASQRMAIDRMLAESLMQTRRSHDALQWWDGIIDVHGAEDFATLLRGAEASLAHGPLEGAAARLQAAADAAADDTFKLSLVQMLQAELAIRKARMDEARDLLSSIVRGAGSVAELRPRAQWLIGETYFLQTRYAEAIDAYRRVDTLDAEGQWAAASLLQAGKAFEKLERSREAATCYTALLTRFGGSSHASQARTRLAHLGSDDSADGPLRR